MYLDGLEDAYEPGKLMGTFAEETARRISVHPRGSRTISRSPSLERAQKAQTSGAFEREIVAGRDRRPQGQRRPSASTNSPRKGDAAKIPTLKPAFSKDGTITAANASSISDGAAALVMTRASVAEQARPRARSPASSRTPPMPMRPRSSPPRRSSRCARRWTRPAGRPTMSTCSRSTRPSPCVAMIAMRDLGHQP